MPQLLKPREHDLGAGFIVRRLLPQVARRTLGPFVFFDHFGPHAMGPGESMDVRPHPHIGLATVTFLWAGSILHRDSLGCVQEINPGDVNWMTAGRGIVHSERTPDRLRGTTFQMHGLQTWIALPVDQEEAEPAFRHYPAATLPVLERDGARITVVAGTAFGAASPVEVASPTLYASLELRAGATLEIPDDHAERGLYPVEGELELDGFPLPNDHIAVLDAGTTPVLRALTNARVMLVGGAPLDGPRHVWWNFVSHSRERIEQAKADWAAGRMGNVPGETEFIPLPER